MSIRRTTCIVVALVMLSLTVATAQYAGPKLEGTATLRSGKTLSGTILVARLGMVDGAEIGSQLRDGGYFKMVTGGVERDVRGTDVAALDVQWANAGTAESPKWQITQMTITTLSGETIAGEPTWMIHLTALEVEQADGSKAKAYAYQLPSSDFSPDNLLARLVIGAVAPATDVGVFTPAPDTGTTATTTEPATPPTTTTSEVVTIEPAPGTTTPPTTTPTTTTPTVTTPTTTTTTTAEMPTITVTAPPLISAVEESAVFRAGQPVVIVFEVTNPETGRPMKVKFLLMPLPAE